MNLGGGKLREGLEASLEGIWGGGESWGEGEFGDGAWDGGRFMGEVLGGIWGEGDFRGEFLFSQKFCGELGEGVSFGEGASPREI